MTENYQTKFEENDLALYQKPKEANRLQKKEEKNVLEELKTDFVMMITHLEKMGKD